MGEKSPNFFICETCHYNTSNKKDYNKHLLTRKHENTTKYNALGIKIPKNPKIYECDCGKSYPYRASLYNHKKICTYLNDKNAIVDSEKLQDFVSRDLFRSILDSEEEHVDVIETHLGLVNKVGKENWLQSQI